MTRGLLLRERRRRDTQVPPAAGERAGGLHGVSDLLLLEAVGGPGSRAALRELFHRHGAAVHYLSSLLAADAEDVDRIVEDVFVTLSRRSGRLEDDVENVRLGLLAMAWRRTGPADDAGAGAVRAPGTALTLTVLAVATLTEVAVVVQGDRRAVAAELRAGLRSAPVARHSDARDLLPQLADDLAPRRQG